MRIFGLTRKAWHQRWVKLLATIWRRLLFRTTFVAVTGSVGKTTCKELLAAVLASRGSTLATTGTDNTAFLIAQTILRARPWHRFVVLEVGAFQPGWIRRASLMARPDIAVILAVGRTHTKSFPTLQDTAREKAALLDGVGPRGVAILNQDDAHVAGMAGGRKFRVVRFGASEHANVRAREITNSWPGRLSLTLEARGETVRVKTRLVGTHWIASVLGAAAAAIECGVPLAQIAQVFERVEPTPGRLDPRVLPSGAVILRDDFNSSLQTFRAALQVVREARAMRKILAITTVTDGEETRNKSLRRVASEAAGVVDHFVLVGSMGDAKRAEKEIVAAGFPAGAFHHFTTIHAASEFLRVFLRDGDLLLIRGRNTDHMGRLYHSQAHDVRCWVLECPLQILCDECPELFGGEIPVLEPQLVQQQST